LYIASVKYSARRNILIFGVGEYSTELKTYPPRKEKASSVAKKDSPEVQKPLPEEKSDFSG